MHRKQGIFVIVCGISQGVDKTQISKWHNWPNKPRKCCTKIKPAFVVGHPLPERLEGAEPDGRLGNRPVEEDGEAAVEAAHASLPNRLLGTVHDAL